MYLISRCVNFTLLTFLLYEYLLLLSDIQSQECLEDINIKYKLIELSIVCKLLSRDTRSSDQTISIFIILPIGKHKT